MKQTLVKQDDLFWNEEDGKYVALSEEEIDSLLMALYGDNITPQTEDIAFQVVKWAEKARIDNLILQGVLSGRIRMYVASAGQDIIFYEEDKLPEKEDEENE